MITFLTLVSFIKDAIANKKLIGNFMVLISFVCFVFLGELSPQMVNAVSEGRSTICKINFDEHKIAYKVKMVITAYSSTEDQTDDSPFITASNKRVADGIIANNMLPFGTKVRIPELYGNKVFVVEDRMHSRKGLYHADIWMPTYKDAKNFGAKISYIEVLEG